MPEKTESNKGVIFTPPKEFRPPDNAKAGEEFDLVCSFEPVEGGKLRLCKLGDVELEYEKGEEEKGTNKPGYGEYARGMMQGMGETGMGQGMEG